MGGFRVPDIAAWHRRAAPIAMQIKADQLSHKRKLAKRLPDLTEKQLARFHSKTDKSGGPDACWFWTGAKTDSGYGVMKVGPRGENVQAYMHRVSWMLANGRDPGDLFVCHQCHVPNCVNPRHLEAQTPSENSIAMHKAGRVPKRRGKGSKLSGPQVREIRRRAANGVLQKDLAALYRVSHQTISDVIRRNVYADIE